MDRECRERCGMINNAEVCWLIDENSRNDDVVIFTDGSVVRGVRSGWGFTARTGGRRVEEQCSAYAITTRSMRMEEEAATAALSWLSTTSYTGAVIVTDSQSMLRKLESGFIKPEWKGAILQSRLKHLVWIFTPGHAGVKGNERADELAGEAALSYDFLWSQRDVTMALEKICEEQAKDSATMERLLELNITKGSGVKSTLRGEERYRVNQLNTGTISSATLSWMLRKKTEHEWTCPNCWEVSPADK